MEPQKFIIISIYILSLIITGFIYAYFYFRARRNKLFMRFIFLLLFIFLWTFNKIAIILSQTDQVAWIFTMLQYFSVCFFGVYFIDFAVEYYYGKPMRKWLQILIYGLGSINYLALLTNPWHHLFFSEFSRVGKSYNFFFYIHTVYSYVLCLLAYLYLMMDIYRRSDFQGALKKTLYSLGLILPTVFNIFHVTDFFHLPLDFTPIMFNFSMTIFAYLSYHRRFLDIREIAQDVIIENLFDGILVVDQNFKIIRYNEIFRYTLSPLCDVKEISDLNKLREVSQKFVNNYDEVVGHLDDFILKGQMTGKLNLSLRNVMGNQEFLLEIQRVSVVKNKTEYYVFRFIELTKYYASIHELNKINQAMQEVNERLTEELIVLRKISVTKERNRISKELHDALGHSLTLVISLLELCKKTVVQNRTHAKEKIQLIKNIIREGYGDLKRVFESQTLDLLTASRLCEDIELLAKKIASIDTMVEIIARHNNPVVEKKYYEAIYRICQEALTNAIRHGEAKRITIGLRINSQGYDLIVADEGIGSKNFEKGNGLMGISQRVEELKGSFSCGSPEGQGFSLHVTLPIL